MVHVTTDAILRVVQPPFVVCSSVGRISFKIFQIPELDEVTENRAWRRAEGRGHCDGWMPSTAIDTAAVTQGADQQHVSHI